MLEIEPMNSTVSDETLSLVALFCDRLTADKLLYEGEEHIRIIRSHPKHKGKAADLDNVRSNIPVYN